MTSSAEHGMPVSMLDDFLAYTLAGTRPGAQEAQGVCANNDNAVRWSWLDDGVLLMEPAVRDDGTRSVLVSAGVHGDETAPIELLSYLVRDIAQGDAALTCRLLVILGNVDAMRDASRYRDDDLNRLFSGRHEQVPHSHEAPRAAALERAATQFFAAASQEPGARWHVDMHTAIRPSAFEQFALLPHTGKPFSRAMFEWLGEARISAVLLHTTKGNTYSHFTAQACGAEACTLELGKVRPFGQNDLTRFAGADEALRHLLAGTKNGDVPTAMPRVFTVIDQLTKQSDAFELLVATDVPNFTPFVKDTVLARDGDYRYTVRHDEERLVFPNATVKPGLRAGLLVVETTQDTLSSLV
ncbi:MULTISPECIES: succinylglutamate desuccinylase [Paraburkholderia]|uniref:Succinylglutamate desuccinylase n=2 Tax=Paraburkholderia madseniana TaxID=2599607 RepID=A0AAP5EU76_9BURK|nr:MULTISPECIES: succinylglutamate desuccinylase [Paraburkholderia]MCX4152108.1 succinylglutamate desuccinylase [Paraburkholderia madseniana]MDN7155036.1 succinylglutamate desuccinylase [Paraburkholderia sp. WS6]MDQ6413919.1 succinylglutamate desuccinylase [Paraburkholderia madseniana]